MEAGALYDLASEVLCAARARKVTLGCAESCTGGLIAAALTHVAGSSDVFVGGIVSYWPSVKTRLLAVPAELIERCGVVSRQVAECMALGALDALGCDYAVATTGIAGPTGAEPGKPVGTVWHGLAHASMAESSMTCCGSSREEVRLLAAAHALRSLLERLAV